MIKVLAKEVPKNRVDKLLKTKDLEKKVVVIPFRSIIKEWKIVKNQ